jgi:methionine-S-sulfoxide reductase
MWSKVASGLLTAVALISFSAMSAGAQSSGGTSMPQTKIERAMFAAGCFWKVQYIFSKVPGVIKTRAGYAGGRLPNPRYEQVCAHTTGHAETVEVEYDQSKVTYHHLLEVFFSEHDPTTPDRQGPDVGPNYRSAIFCTTPEQMKEALAYKGELEAAHKFRRPIVTQIQLATPFYAAEDYHQDYYAKHGAVCF